ncbi:MAG: 1-acyl-sn-glycerol-3-phosphate acyltransferase [Deltaproteobacteria bacterium]|nr:1-acyl-sn-glycerol-3-phosphate acyltransferase [Deltaproteobacteria bacterium]MBN2687969.1 1-acyl-sn-glycerol-3-phosphate acyltransferase [Deltaproteobacteria bacterium]
MTDINAKRRHGLNIQRTLGRLASVVIGPLLYFFIKGMKYRVYDLKRIRETVRASMEKHDGPWLICPNHLTMIDSLIIAYALAPLYRYIVDYRMLPWNLPERANFQRNLLLALLCYLSKCIPVSRGGDRAAMKDTLETCVYLLTKGERLLIFPEGGRSRTGRVSGDNFSYGVGRFITTVENCRVMSVYLRGDGQVSYSNIPRFGERFTMTIDTVCPSSPFNGLKGQRECARQIVERLQQMEEDYFARRGQ